MLSRLDFAHLPTPVEELKRLSAQLEGPQILIKRDDQTGLAFGGNKTRKLEFLLADAQNQGAETLITGGAVQSNHCRQTAAAAARNGFSSILVLTGDKPVHPSGNNFLDLFLGAEIVWAEGKDRDALLQLTYNQALAGNRKPYLIPYGGSNPIGVMGYVYALREVMEQVESPDWIIFPSSSGGTQAGLALGGRMMNFQGKILGISIDDSALELSKKVASLAEDTAQVLGINQTFSPGDIFVNDDYLGGGYGIMGEPEKEALSMFALNEGILLDPVYTGRAAAGLIDLIRKGIIPADHRVLFWHTGGTPAIFADRYMVDLLG